MSKITGQTAAKSVSNMRSLHTYFSGSHSEAIVQTRKGRTKYGYYLMIQFE